MPGKEYETFLGSECLLACFQNILKLSDLTIDECDVFILGEGFTVRYCVAAGDKPGIMLSGNVHGSVFKFCNDYSIGMIVKEKLSDAEVKDDMLQCLSLNNPITVKTDPGYLKYSPIYTNGHGLIHFVNIIKYNLKDNAVLLSDGFIPSIPPSTYHGWYDYGLLEKGRSLKDNYTIVFATDRLKKGEALAERIREGKCEKFKASLKKYLHGSADGHYTYGIAALRQFAQDIPQFPGLLGDGFSEGMFRLNYSMKIHGPVSSKFLLYKAFKGLNENNHYDMGYELSNALAEVAKEWNKISLLVVRAGVLKSRDSLKALSDRVKTVISWEEKVYGKILSVL